MAASEDGSDELPRYGDIKRDPVPVEEVRVCLVADLGDCEPSTIMLRSDYYDELRQMLLKKQLGEKLGLRISDQQVTQAVKTFPAFQRDGKWILHG